ncbi:hypothetical protein [Rhabdaerophilum calidifontis]|uniref:hypothetical protein n=1 Tax=Rhabdaerophilum calidifontis TaxID=2604328 RepID=UPI001239A6D0|nr:hypothetical protein [Rhabdaerophilum calidifontis]
MSNHNPKNASEPPTGPIAPTVREKYSEFDRQRIELSLIEAADALVTTTEDARNSDHADDLLKGQIERRAADLALRLLALEVDSYDEFQRKYAALFAGPYPKSSGFLYSLAAFAMRLEAVRLGIEVHVEHIPDQTH